MPLSRMDSDQSVGLGELMLISEVVAEHRQPDRPDLAAVGVEAEDVCPTPAPLGGRVYLARRDVHQLLRAGRTEPAQVESKGV